MKGKILEKNPVTHFLPESESSMDLKMPKRTKMSAKDINAFVDGLNFNQLCEVGWVLSIGYEDKRLSCLRPVLVYIAEVQSADQQFENLNSERDHAYKVASSLIQQYHLLLAHLENLPEEYSEIAQKILYHGLRNFMFVRVLGDKLGEYEGLIKNLHALDVLKMKTGKYHLRRYLTENNGKTFDAEYLNRIINNMEG